MSDIDLAIVPVHQLPGELDSLLHSGGIRELDDIADLATLMIRAISEGRISPKASKELRQWAELAYSAVAAKNPDKSAKTNIIAQLVQIGEQEPSFGAGTPDARMLEVVNAAFEAAE